MSAWGRSFEVFFVRWKWGGVLGLLWACLSVPEIKRIRSVWWAWLMFMSGESIRCGSVVVCVWKAVFPSSSKAATRREKWFQVWIKFFEKQILYLSLLASPRQLRRVRRRKALSTHAREITPIWLQSARKTGSSIKGNRLPSDGPLARRLLRTISPQRERRKGGNSAGGARSQGPRHVPEIVSRSTAAQAAPTAMTYPTGPCAALKLINQSSDLAGCHAAGLFFPTEERPRRSPELHQMSRARTMRAHCPNPTGRSDRNNFMIALK